MKRFLIIIISTAILVLSQAGCARKPAEDSKVLAKVSNKTITLGEFKARISKLPPYYQEIVNRNRKRYLDDTILEMMLYEEAIRKGLDRDREVKEVINEARKKLLVSRLVQIEVEEKIKVDEGEIRVFYENHKDEFKTPELWRASHILVASENEARDLLNELAQGANFEELAKAHSIDATQSRGGDIGYFRSGQLVPDFEKACLQLKVGETSGIVHTKFGYHIIRLTDRKEPSTESYEKVKRRIEDELKKKKKSESFDNLVTHLKDKYRVEMEEDAFKILEKPDEGKRGVKE